MTQKRNELNLLHPLSVPVWCGICTRSTKICTRHIFPCLGASPGSGKFLALLALSTPIPCRLPGQGWSGPHSLKTPEPTLSLSKGWSKTELPFSAHRSIPPIVFPIQEMIILSFQFPRPNTQQLPLIPFSLMPHRRILSVLPLKYFQNPSFIPSTAVSLVWTATTSSLDVP